MRCAGVFLPTVGREVILPYHVFGLLGAQGYCARAVQLDLVLDQAHCALGLLCVYIGREKLCRYGCGGLSNTQTMMRWKHQSGADFRRWRGRAGLPGGGTQVGWIEFVLCVLVYNDRRRSRGIYTLGMGIVG